MARSYSNFRRTQRAGGPFRRGQPAPRAAATATFIGHALGGIMMVAIFTWHATPLLRALWHNVGVPAEQIARTEQSVYYARCGDARAAGVAPIYRGARGYREGLDADDDGVACEQQRTP